METTGALTSTTRCPLCHRHFRDLRGLKVLHIATHRWLGKWFLRAWWGVR